MIRHLFTSAFVLCFALPSSCAQSEPSRITEHNSGLCTIAHIKSATEVNVHNDDRSIKSGSEIVEKKASLPTAPSEFEATKACSTAVPSEFKSTKASSTAVPSEFESTKAFSTTVASEFESTRAFSTAVPSEFKFTKASSTVVASEFESTKASSTTVASEFQSAKVSSTGTGSETDSTKALSTTIQSETESTKTESTLQSDSKSTSVTSVDSSNQTITHRPKIALALGGGGTRGYAHIGVLRIFQREGIPIDMIAGTSMGSIVGGFFCAGLTPDEIQQKMLAKSFAHSFYTVPIPVRVAAIPIFIIPHMFGYHPYDGLYVGNRFANYLNNSLPASLRDIEELKIPYCAVASNLLDGKAYSLKTGNLGRAIQASSAVPELRRPVQIGDKLFVDGGIEANLPVIQAKEMGADIVIGVNVDEKFDARRRDFRKILSVGHRVINMILTKVDEEQVKAADLIVQPDVNGIHLLSSKTSDGLKAIKAGEEAAQAALPEIRSRIKAAAVAAK